MGGTYVLDALWKRLELDETLKKLLAKRSFEMEESDEEEGPLQYDHSKDHREQPGSGRVRQGDEGASPGWTRGGDRART